MNNDIPDILTHGYPWQGTYFKGVELELEALPNPGYVFSHWEGYDYDHSLLRIVPSDDITIKAVFKLSL